MAKKKAGVNVVTLGGEIYEKLGRGEISAEKAEAQLLGLSLGISEEKAAERIRAYDAAGLGLQFPPLRKK